MDKNEPLVLLDGDLLLLSPEYYKKGLPGATKEMYLRQCVYDKLLLAHTFLPAGYRFKVFDAYREIETQKYLWEMFFNQLKRKHPGLSTFELIEKTKEFVSNPFDVDRVPLHCTGGAIDLTVVGNGGELDMGTAFDDFTDVAHTDCFRLLEGDIASRNRIIAYNRSVLYDAMTKAGFVNLPSEWWHYDYGNWRWSEVTGYKRKF